jgi:hypothetical protein
MYTVDQLDPKMYSTPEDAQFMQQQIHDVISEISWNKYKLGVFYVPYTLHDKDTPEYIIGSHAEQFDTLNMLHLNKIPEYPRTLRTNFKVKSEDIKMYIISD